MKRCCARLALYGRKAYGHLLPSLLLFYYFTSNERLQLLDAGCASEQMRWKRQRENRGRITKRGLKVWWLCPAGCHGHQCKVDPRTEEEDVIFDRLLCVDTDVFSDLTKSTHSKHIRSKDAGPRASL